MPALVPIAVHQAMNEQPLDLSKKDVFTIRAVKDNDSHSRNTTSPCGQKEETNNWPTRQPEQRAPPETEDMEDSPLVIDEETCNDAAVNARRAPPPIDASSKVYLMGNVLQLGVINLNTLLF